VRRIAILAALALAPTVVRAQDMSGMTMAPPAQAPRPAQATAPAATAAAPAAPAPGGDMAGMEGMSPMTGALGSYSMNREASGTSWQPDASPDPGIHIMRGPWMFMVHGAVNAVYDHQSGPRGAEETFASGMIMLMARRGLANLDTVNFRAMLSPDPFMGPRGYPLLLQTGETADGKSPLVDRQHPHDLFMELSASYTHRFNEHDSAFLYAGLPGEPAFGPPAFMHRASIMDSPEAPISHHWLDSTHITMGVLTAGFVHDAWKIEASAFKGREPDQHRWDIEAPRVDSAAVRLSWNPTARLALQASWAYQKSPEQLAPRQDDRRLSASAIYTQPIGAHGWWSTTAAWGLRDLGAGVRLNAFVLESAIAPDDAWTLFVRGESVQNDELAGANGPTYTVGKISAGAIHDWRVAKHLKLGLGALYAFDFIPAPLRAAYGADPHGVMAFLRAKMD
jgi:hypothetical protein